MIFIIVAIGIFYLFYLRQDILLFNADKLDKNVSFDFDGDFVEQDINMSDDVKLNSVILKTPESRGLIMFIHGNAGTISYYHNYAKRYNDLGYDFLVYDYRGFGKSEGRIMSEEQMFDDAQHIYNYAKTLYPEDKIIIVGFSIGTGIAANLASKNNQKELVLIAPYFDMQSLLKERQVEFLKHVSKFKLETNKYLQDVKSPIFIFHGDNDETINVSNSERLKKLLDKKVLLTIIHGAKHVDINYNDELFAKLKENLV